MSPDEQSVMFGAMAGAGLFVCALFIVYLFIRNRRR